MVTGRVRVDIAATAAGWLAPWAAWLAGAGGVAGVVMLVVAAFWVTPLLAVPLAVLACGLQWGIAGTAAFLHGLGALVTGRPLPPDLLARVGTLLAWLALAWRAAAAASRPVTRSGVETELRQGGVGWVGLALTAFWSPPRLFGVTLLGLGTFVAGGLDALTLSQLREFERRYGAAAGRRGYRSSSASALWIVVGGGTLAAWLLAGGGGILPGFFHVLDQTLALVLTPLLLGVGYIAQVVLSLLNWLLHGKKLHMPHLNAQPGVPKGLHHAASGGGTPLWLILTGRWVLVLALIGGALLVLALLRAHAREEVSDTGVTEEREKLAAGPTVREPPHGWGRARGADPDLAIRRIFRRWLELAADRGRGRRAHETAREHVGRVIEEGGRLSASAQSLLQAYEHGRYGRGDRAADVSAAQAALDTIRRRWRP